MKISFPHTRHNVFLVLLILSLSIYSNVLQGEFISDDYIHIVNNYAVRDAVKFDNLWQSFNTRFLVGLTFALNYAWGGLNTFGYHLVNILLHALTAFVVYQLIAVLLSTPALADQYTDKKRRSIALVSSLIFLCHPIQTQAVAFITQRFVVMGTLFYLLTVLLYTRSRVGKREGLYWASMGTMLLAAFSKEMTVTIPFALLLIEALFFKVSFAEKHFAVLKRLLPFCVILIILPLSLWQDKFGSNLGLKFQLYDRGINWHYFLTELNVLRTYLRLLIFPVNQNHDYDYPLSPGIGDGPTLCSVLLLAGLLWTAIRLKAKDPVISFCILWFFLTTSVEVAVVSVVNRGLIYEHWLYLPMTAFALLVTVLIRRLSSTDKMYRMLFILIVGLCCLLTYQRNFVWQTETGFWNDNLIRSPRKAGPYFGMGKALERKCQADQAEWFYKKALCLDQKFTYAHNNLALLYIDHGQDELAAEHLKKAIAIDPGYGPVYNNFAFLSFLNKRYQEAITYYEQSLQVQGEYPQGLYYLAQCYWSLGDKDRARSLTERAITLYDKRNDPQGSREAAEFLKKIK